MCFLPGSIKKIFPQNREKIRREKFMKWDSKNTSHLGIHLQVSNMLTFFFFFFLWFFLSLLQTNVLAFFSPLILSGQVGFFSFFSLIFSRRVAFLFFFLLYLFIFYHMFIFSLILVGFCFCFFLRKQFGLISYAIFFFTLMKCPSIHNFFF